MVLSQVCPFKVARGNGAYFALQGCFMCGYGPYDEHTVFLHLLLLILFSSVIFSGVILVIVPIIICLMGLAVTARENYVWDNACRGSLGYGPFFVVCHLGRFLLLVVFPPLFFLGQLLSCKANLHSELDEQRATYNIRVLSLGCQAVIGMSVRV
ncbi:hypothetical protein JB92DRAFT_2911198 [Gautieria morchelliformis]|nr:hypothetical protein JB92DRAFT_2911198 [Gautieria morchelliformis]